MKMGGSWWLRIFDWQVADMVALNVGEPVAVTTGEFFSISAEFESHDLRAAAGGAAPHATHLGDCRYQVRARVMHVDSGALVLDFGMAAVARALTQWPAAPLSSGNYVVGEVNLVALPLGGDLARERADIDELVRREVLVQEIVALDRWEQRVDTANLASLRRVDDLIRDAREYETACYLVRIAEGVAEQRLVLH